MPYIVPAYTDISHFRAPYKDSVMGFGAVAGSGKPGSSKVGVSRSAASYGRAILSRKYQPAVSKAQIDGVKSQIDDQAAKARIIAQKAREAASLAERKRLEELVSKLVADNEALSLALSKQQVPSADPAQDGIKEELKEEVKEVIEGESKILGIKTPYFLVGAGVLTVAAIYAMSR